MSADATHSDDDGLIWVALPVPKCSRPPSSPPPGEIPADVSSPSPSSSMDHRTPTFDFKSVSDHLRSLANAVQDLSRPVTSSADLLVDSAPPLTLLSALPPEKIVEHFHYPGSPLPAVRPCDTANASDTKTHWSSEELHRIMGCRKFRNYKQILHVSRDGEWVDGGEFHPSLGFFATIPKAKRGKLLDRSRYRYLDAVHMDISPLVIAFRLAASATHSSSLIGLLGTIGLLASNPFPRTAFSLPFASFVRWLGLLPGAFTVTVIPNYLEPPFPNISSTTAPRSSLLRLSVNLLMVSLNLTGK